MKLPNWMKGSLEPDLYLPTYLKRWYVIPKNNVFNVYLHRFEGDDGDRALHNHPWNSVSILLKGELTENYKYDLYDNVVFHRRIKKWLPYFRGRQSFHSMFLPTLSAWTLFMTGRHTQEWGFEYPQKYDFMHYADFKRIHGDYGDE